MIKALLLLFLFTMTSCEDLPADLPIGDPTDPHYWGDFYLKKYESERLEFNTNIEPSPGVISEPRTVLLITGVTIPAEWMEGLRLRLERDGFRTVVWEPRDLLSYDLFEATHDLSDVVDRVVAESGEAKIDILAECTGGLIARHYVQSLGGDQKINRLVTFVSPQGGVEKAPKAANIAKWPALFDLSPGSDFLEAVEEKRLPDQVDMTSIYACDDEWIQPFTTSIVEGAVNIELCGDEFIGHFRTMFDREIYLIMYDALTAPLSFEATADLEPEEVDDRTVVGGTDDTTEQDNDASGCATTEGPNALFPLVLFFGLILFRRRRRMGAIFVFAAFMGCGDAEPGGELGQGSAGEVENDVSEASTQSGVTHDHFLRKARLLSDGSGYFGVGWDLGGDDGGSGFVNDLLRVSFDGDVEKIASGVALGVLGVKGEETYFVDSETEALHRISNGDESEVFVDESRIEDVDLAGDVVMIATFANHIHVGRSFDDAVEIALGEGARLHPTGSPIAFFDRDAVINIMDIDGTLNAKGPQATPDEPLEGATQGFADALCWRDENRIWFTSFKGKSIHEYDIELDTRSIVHTFEDDVQLLDCDTTGTALYRFQNTRGAFFADLSQ